MKWINNTPPGNPIQLVPVNRSVRLCLVEATMVISVESCGFQPQTPSPSWSSRNGGVVVAADAVFSTVASHCRPARDGTICLLN